MFKLEDNTKGAVMKQKSLGLIAILNTVNTMLGMLFPLITFPYISRVLGVENLGKINFSSSVVSYFALIAALGIYTYATREGAMLRENKKTFQCFANEIFTINIISTCFAYIFLLVFALSILKLREYRLLMAIQSLSIIFTTIGVSWIYTIYEDYLYIVIRNIIFQFLSLILLFLFVRETKDYIIYVIVTLISNGGSNFFNFFHAKKFVKLKIECNKKCFRHMKSIMLIFASTIASTIYVNSDMMILGFMWGDSPVGLYSISVKIYSILKTLVSAVFGVALPRVSLYFSSNREKEANEIINLIIKFSLFLVAPIVVGVCLLCNEVVIIIGGKEYIDAALSLNILMFAFIFSIFASLFSTLVLLPKGFEKIITIASITSAIINILLNFYFIKYWKQNGAAFTTMISEIIVCIIYYYYSKKQAKLKVSLIEIGKILIAAIFMIPIAFFIKLIVHGFWFRTIIVICSCSFIYFVCLFMLRSTVIKIVFNQIRSKVKKH